MEASRRSSASLPAHTNLACHEDHEDLSQQKQEEIVTSRAYQLEMLEKSMQRNIIVTVSHFFLMLLHMMDNSLQMETGSGKTWMYVRCSFTRFFRSHIS
jgi:restriction endonuclease